MKKSDIMFAGAMDGQTKCSSHPKARDAVELRKVHLTQEIQNINNQWVQSPDCPWVAELDSVEEIPVG